MGGAAALRHLVARFQNAGPAWPDLFQEKQSFVYIKKTWKLTRKLKSNVWAIQLRASFYSIEASALRDKYKVLFLTLSTL